MKNEREIERGDWENLLMIKLLISEDWKLFYKSWFFAIEIFITYFLTGQLNTALF